MGVKEENMSKYFDATEIRKALTYAKPNGELYEIRVVNGKKILSGYFTDADTLIKELGKQNLQGGNVYITLNALNSACYDREQKNQFVFAPKQTTGDSDVIGYEWLMIDLDPKRVTGTSSTEEELQAAKDLANKIFDFMKTLGFNKPLAGFSGNGVHLLYKIKLLNNAENRKLVENCLKALDILFSTDDVQVDLKNFNQSRVCKLYGTLAQKGSDSKERPHRMSRMVSEPDELPTEKAYLEKLASYIPKVDDSQQYNNFSPKDFDVATWMDKYQIGYKRVSINGGEKFVLDHCPFNSEHTGKDAAVIRLSNGALSFNCFHNSCAGKTWKDLRLLYEPTAYEKKWENQKKIQYGSYNRNKSPRVIPDNPNEPKFFELIDVVHSPEPDYEFIKTGIHEIDRKMQGLIKPSVSVVTGLRGSAKSTVLSEIGLNAVEGGNNVSYFSGELNPKKFTRWMMLQAAGRSRVDVGQFEGTYNVPIRFQELIGKWLYGKLRLRNNYYGNSFSVMIKDFEEEIKKHHTDLLILDNLMALDVSDLAATKWDAQTEFVLKLQELAKQYNVAVVFVAHPRKAMGLLRFDDIAGTADLGNAVDNAFIVHRINEDFRRLSKEMFHWKDDNEIYKATNCIEIVKDREFGTQDVFVPLWYEEKTKRLKNEPAENVIYGWDVGNIPVPDETPDARTNYSTVDEPVFD